jgi:DNA-directed RNA polymerase specialized sigma subunit
MTYVWDAAVPSVVYGAIVSLDSFGLGFSATDSDDGSDETLDIADPSPGPLGACEAEEVHVAVSVFVRSLAPRDREIVRRLFWLGETQTEVAQYLGVSKMAISKAMAKIAGRGRRRLAPFRASDVML